MKTLYNWRRKYGGLGVSEAKRLKQLGDENRRLRRIVADMTLNMSAMEDVISSKW